MSPLAIVPLVFASTFGAMNSAPADDDHQGFVVAAPHEGFDSNTGPMAEAIGRELGWGWVVADGYRSTRRRHWFDVNRPTQRFWHGDGFGDRSETDDAQEIYAEYQALVA